MGSEEKFFTQSQVDDILRRDRRSQNANIAEGRASAPKLFTRVTIDLTAASTEQNPYPLGFPFKSLRVETATDPNVSVNIRPNSPDPWQEHTSISMGDVLNLGNGVSKAFLFWSAQAGKSITLVLFFDAEFRPGKNISQNSGGVSVSEGTSITSRAAAGVSISTAVSILLPADAARICETWQNQSASSVWTGDSGVTDDTGANPGIEVPPGGIGTWKNTAALYAVTKSATALTKFSRNVER